MAQNGQHIIIISKLILHVVCIYRTKFLKTLKWEHDKWQGMSGKDPLHCESVKWRGSTWGRLST